VTILALEQPWVSKFEQAGSNSQGVQPPTGHITNIHFRCGPGGQRAGIDFFLTG
jgi:hypothetical protein